MVHNSVAQPVAGGWRQAKHSGRNLRSTRLGYSLNKLAGPTALLFFALSLLC